MTTASTIRSDARSDARRRLSEAILEAARDITVAGGWGAFRMAAVADRVGVSRQTLYTEFGTKEALGQALVLRETDTFLLGVSSALDQHPEDLTAAIREAVTHTLAASTGNPLLQTVLVGSSDNGNDSLLPLLTSRSQPVLHRASELLCLRVAADHPELPPATIEEVVDSLVRLVVSHLVMPVDSPAAVGQRLARLTEGVLRLPT